MFRAGINPYAPPAYNGIGQLDVPGGYKDQSFDYVFNVTLTASQVLQTQLSVENDADFPWRATVINLFTGAFSVRFSDSDDYWLSSGRIINTNIQGNPSSPYPEFPEVIIPAGGKIGIDIADLSVAENTIQILFRGVKRFAIA
jgi:hypothetical protein